MNDQRPSGPSPSAEEPRAGATGTAAIATGAAAARVRALARFAPWLLPLVGIGLLLPVANRLPLGEGGLVWALDLAAHWQVLYAPLWLMLCLIAGFRAKPWLLLMPLALLPWWTASPALPAADADMGADASPALIVAVANVHASNREPARLLAWLRARPADVVVLNELTPAFAEALTAAAGDLYPYRAFAPDNSPFGIGVMARRPLTDVEVFRSADGIPAIAARVDAGGRAARVVAVHPMPPLAPHWHRQRDLLLRTLAAQADPLPRVVAGDLNASPWSTALLRAARPTPQEHARANARTGELRRSTGLGATWSHRVLGLHVGIPIDHVLADGCWRCGRSERGPQIGSDHRPIRVELHWASRTCRD
jgi:endonuclease/exonuclease/phosphatase (EEP) superfamily protein YafD